MEIKNTEITGQSVTFQVKTDAQNQVVGLLNRQDQYHMNWVKAHEIWGKVHTTVDLNVTVSRQLTDESLTETYVFTNSTKFEMDTLDTDVGIDVPLPDYYTKASVGLTQCSNTHIWCGETCSYLMALRQGGQAPHLGLLLQQGSLKGYSIQRSYDFSGREEEVSNTRGVIRLHPENFKLQPGESYTLSWKLFWFNGKNSSRRFCNEHQITSM